MRMQRSALQRSFPVSSKLFFPKTGCLLCEVSETIIAHDVLIVKTLIRLSELFVGLPLLLHGGVNVASSGVDIGVSEELLDEDHIPAFVPYSCSF